MWTIDISLFKNPHPLQYAYHLTSVCTLIHPDLSPRCSSFYLLANEVTKGYSNVTVRPSFRNSEHSRINILQWILTKLGTYLVLKRIWNTIDFQVIGQRSRSPGQICRRGGTPRFAFPLFALFLFCFVLFCFAWIRSVSCVPRCLCFWIVHSWLSHRLSVTFICPVSCAPNVACVSGLFILHYLIGYL